ncbi:flagellar basal body P-ring protein FlgI [Oxalobacter vibrioformis]|uniref:Flagellar P-ring protein n=1 Tax=Oxalobacter vibrioformis TaxID=933080 RepID=A0A9E9LUR1_9BURK|nr:flagellar basal body P-ring protein FlgI [Oxalobacter vibrioformis]WAW09531.1 flagellar basal body P-ring protein FlgI [Oxalobacter vibrioformis]
MSLSVKAIGAFLLGLGLFASVPTYAERIRDLATIQGVRNNQLLGYGLVVGLDGSGDQTTQTPFTVQSIVNMLQQLGVTVPFNSSSLQMKNVAAVMVTANLPPFAQPGQMVDVVVSSIGNAKSLKGGTLLLTPLKGADGNIYGMAQGNLVVGGAGASAGGSSAKVNHLAAGRISNGATIEREVPSTIHNSETITLELTDTNFSTVSRMVGAINTRFGMTTASAVNGRVIRVKAPQSPDARVAFIGELENLDVTPAVQSAKVILNARTGSVVMNQTVTLDTCAISHGNLSVIVNTENTASQPAPFSQGQTTMVENAQIEIKKDEGEVILLNRAATLADVVKALNSIGATPQDLLAILQAMKASGSLRAELEVI